MVPLHSHKLTATLQHVLVEDAESPQRNPIITRVEVRAGHGAGKPTEKIIAGARQTAVSVAMRRLSHPLVCMAPSFRKAHLRCTDCLVSSLNVAVIHMIHSCSALVPEGDSCG